MLRSAGMRGRRDRGHRPIHPFAACAVGLVLLGAARGCGGTEFSSTEPSGASGSAGASNVGGADASNGPSSSTGAAGADGPGTGAARGSNGASTTGSNGAAGSDDASDATGSGSSGGAGGDDSAETGGGGAESPAGNGGMTSGGTGAQGGTGAEGGTGGGDPCAGAGATSGGPEIVAGLNDRFFIAKCYGDSTDHDCYSTSFEPCDGGLTIIGGLSAAGDACGVYDVTIKVRGIVEANRYTGGERRAGTAALDTTDQGGDAWYVGGMPDPESTHNVYQLRVTPGVLRPNGVDVYFFNAAADAGEEIGKTFVLDYTATFPVRGASAIALRQFDSDCRSVRNCGDFTSGCPAPRTLADVELPLVYLGEDLEDNNPEQPFVGQFLHIELVDVQAR